MNKDDIPIWTDLRLANINGKQVKSLAITLRTRPCRFQESTGSCKFCELKKLASPTVSDQNLVNQVKNTLEPYRIKNEMPEHIDLFGLGTFFDNIEIPIPAREEILDYLSKITIESLRIESRAQYLTLDRLMGAKQRLHLINLEIAIGIESTNAEIRENWLNKKYSEELIERSISLLGETGVGFLGYVLFKPPIVFDDNKEQEAIDDAVQSSLDIFELGRKYSVQTRVGLNPFYLPDSNQYTKKELKNYTPPSLWGVVEVIKRTHSSGTTFIGLNNEGLVTDYHREAHGCEKCTNNFRNSIMEYNGTRDIEKLLSFYCGCKEDFLRKIK